MAHRSQGAIALKLLCFALVFVAITRVDLSQAVPNSCYQNQVFINGKVRTACQNGYLDDNNVCVAYTMPQCPENYVLMNGLCYVSNQLPRNVCPEGYYLYNSLCYPIAPKPCPFDTTPTPPFFYQTTYQPEIPPTPQPTAEPVTEPRPQPRPQPQPQPQRLPPTSPPNRCPTGTIFTQGQCRKIMCPLGEFYKGRCLQPACPEGSVWRGRRCQEPGYITTILEIENVLINELHDHPGKVIPVNINKVEYHTRKPNVTKTTTEPIRTPPRPTISAVRRTTTTATTPKPANMEEGCCTVTSPRMCKLYGQKWVCFNRRYKHCDSKVCTHSLINLKVDKILYEPQLLIMPPNPPLEACITPGCDSANAVDCSGCAHNQRETCSPYCYKYLCPADACNFVDLRDYCAEYPGEFGCTKQNGSPWNWNGEKYN